MTPPPFSMLIAVDSCTDKPHVRSHHEDPPSGIRWSELSAFRTGGLRRNRRGTSHIPLTETRRISITLAGAGLAFVTVKSGLDG